jgi:hypothetical protein
MSAAVDVMASSAFVDGPPPELATGKRKRARDPDDGQTARGQEDGSHPSAGKPPGLDDLLSDILDLLKT